MIHLYHLIKDMKKRGNYSWTKTVLFVILNIGKDCDGVGWRIERMNEQTKRKKTKLEVFSLVLGWFFFLLAVVGIVSDLGRLLDWNRRKENYRLEYADLSSGNLSYELEGKRVLVESITDLKGNSLDLNMDDGETVALYCSNENPSHCVYFKQNLRGVSSLLFDVFFLILGLSCIFYRPKKKNNQFTVLSIVFSVTLILGIVVLLYQGKRWLTYLEYKQQGNKVEAVIYSELYHRPKYSNDNVYGSSIRRYHCAPIASYSVNGKEYRYIHPIFLDVEFSQIRGEKITLYYDKKDPSKAIWLDRYGNFMIVAGLVLVLFSLLFLFLIRRAQRKRKQIEEVGKG